MALTDILSEVTRGATIAESILPLLVKIAGEAASANTPLGLGALMVDIVTALPQIVSAIKANNTEVILPAEAPEAPGAPA